MNPRALILGFLVLSLPALASVSSFGPETALTPPSVVHSTTLQSYPAVAANGDGFLAAWFDSRDQQGIYATRIDVTGHVVDQPSFLVAKEQGPLAATGIGRDTLLAVAVCGGLDVFRIDESRAITASAHVQTENICWTSVSIATNGSTVVVTYAGRVSVFDASLTPKQNATIDSAATFSAVASNGSDFIVASGSQSPAAVATHLDANGAILSAHPFTFPNNVNSIVIASNGTDYLILGGGVILGAQRVDANGLPMNASKMVHIAAAPRAVIVPALAWSGREYLAIYFDAPFISSSQLGALVRLDSDATALGEQSLGDSRDASIAVHDGRAAVVSNGVRLTAQISSTDNPTALTIANALSTATPTQFTPKLVDANGTLTYFWRERGDSAQVLKAKIAGGSEVTLANPMASDYSAGFDGARYVVVWQSANAIQIQRFAPDLTPLDPSPVAFSPVNPIARPVAAIANGRALVSWLEATNTGEVKAIAIDTTTATMTIPQPVTLSAFPFSNDMVAVAWNGSDFAVVWAHELGPILDGLFSQPTEVLARHVSRDGAIISDTIQLARLDSYVGWLGAAGNYAAWSTRGLVYGKLIRAEGSALPIGPITSTGGLNVSTYRDGYVVAWPAPGSQFSTYSPALGIVDADGTPQTMYATEEMPHSFLSDDVDFKSGVLIYMRTANEPQYGGVSRLFTRTFAPVPPRRRAAAR